MKKVLVISSCFLATLCLAQPNPLNDPNYQLQWYNNFSQTTNPWTKSSGAIQSASSSNIWYVGNMDDHGGEPEVYLDANTTIGTDFSNTSDPNNYLRFQAIKQAGTTCSTCTQSLHNYSSGMVVLWDAAQYGYVEIKAKISNTYATWAAFWLWTESNIGCFGGINGSLYSSTYNIAVPTNTVTLLAPQTSSVTTSLKSASFIDYNNGYIVGSGGTVLKTINASGPRQSPVQPITWTPQTISAIGTTNLNSVCFTDINTGYIVGAAGKVFKVTSASSSSPNWSLATTVSGTPDLNSVCFPWANFGFTSPYANTGYVAGNSGVFSKTTDAGSTWTTYTLSGASTYSLMAVASNDNYGGTPGTANGNVFIAGGDATHSFLTISTDFGSTWTPVTLSGVNTRLNSIWFTDANHCFIAGNSGIIIRGVCNSSGIWTWASSTNGTNNLYSISFRDGNNGYAVGANGAVYYTTTGSATTTPTWTLVTNSTNNNIPSTDLNFVYCNFDYDEMDIFEQAAGTYVLDATSPYNGQYRDKNTLTCNYGVPYNSLPSGGNPSAVGSTYPISDFSQWHTYGVEWSPSTITYYIDNQISRIIPNPGFQVSTGNGGKFSQRTNILLNVAISGFVKWNDISPDCNSSTFNCYGQYASADWPGKNCPSGAQCASPSVANNPTLYDPYYSTTTSPASPFDYSKYYDPTTAGGPPGGYAGYPASSMNTTSFNTTATPFMMIDHVGYWKLNNGTPGSGPCWTGNLNYKNLTDVNGYPNQPQNSIIINPGQTGGSNITTNGSSPTVIRASSFIEIDGGTNGEFTTGSGMELLLDISACY